MTYETIWERKTPNFRVALEAAPDDDFVLDFEDPDGSTADNLASGLWTAFQFKVAVYDADGREIGADYLGGSIYENASEFIDHRLVGRSNREYAAKGERGRCGSYFTDMLHTAIAEARKAYNEPRARLRSA